LGCSWQRTGWQCFLPDLNVHTNNYFKNEFSSNK